MVTRSARGRVDGSNSGAAAEAPGMQMVSVKTTGGGDDSLGGLVPSAPLRRGDEEPMEVDAPPEAEPRPLSIARLQGRWFQRFCARVETEGTTSFSLGRLGVFQHRGGNGDGFPGVGGGGGGGGCGVGWDRQGAMSCVSRHKVDDT